MTSPAQNGWISTIIAGVTETVWGLPKPRSHVAIYQDSCHSNKTPDKKQRDYCWLVTNRPPVYVVIYGGASCKESRGKSAEDRVGNASQPLTASHFFLVTLFLGFS